MQHASQFRTFANDAKIPVIRPLLIDGYFISDFQAKACRFNKVFAQHRTTDSTENPLPSNETLTTVNFVEQLISKLNLDLNSHKAHGHDEVSAHMLQVCLDSISKLLSIIFKNSLKTGCYPIIWKKANVATYTKKEANKL